MSLQNPNNIVTEERLAEFYQQILPYLGGMPDVLANKFNRADLYSTDEKMIGRWIDGKPLYQKTFSGTATGSSSTWVEIGAIETVIPNIETLTALNGYGFEPSESLKKVFELSIDVNGYGILEFKQTFTGSSMTYTYYVTIQYTKTTDSAVEIGSDTDYSTTEKIVGTWIDGKPLWQRTVSFVSNGTNWKTIGTDFDHSNWDSSFVKEVSINTSSDGEFYGGNQVYGILIHTPSSLKDVFEVHCPSWSSGSTGYVTVCYTKTSS